MKKETELFKHTNTAEKILLLDKVYKEIEEAENEWTLKCSIKCIEGCGACCTHFEPEIYEIEALYLASWLLYNQRWKALQILEGNFQANILDKENGCILFDTDNPYHCTAYGGRCLICRLFGYSGSRGKDLSVRWRPCKYLTSISKELSASNIKQYSEEDLLNNFGMLPPVMSDFTSRILCFMTENSSHPEPLRKMLPAAISKILMLENYSHNPDFEPDTDPETPPLAS